MSDHNDTYRPPNEAKIRALGKVVTPSMEALKKIQRRDSAQQARLEASAAGRVQIGLQHADGWANVMTGMGGPMDKRKYNFFAEYPIITDPELERMYFGDGLAARIVDVVADDMTREWIKLEADEEDDQADEDALDVIADVMQDIDAQGVFNEAVKWKGLYGGAVIVMGVLDGQTLDQPLNVNRITGFDYLRVIDRSDIDLFQSVYQNDPSLPGFGQPVLLYLYFQVGVVRYPKLVHISRCCVLKGKKVPTGATPTTTLTQRFWGLSMFNGLYDVIADYNSNMSSAVSVMQEFCIGKFKMSGLADMMAEGNENTVQARMQLISTMKSVIHAVMLDAENEDYTRDTVALTGVSEVIDRSALRVCAAAGIPYTRLWGDSPGGLSTDDESGRKTYYDMIRSKQHTELLPAIKKLVMVIQAWKKTKTDVKIEFNPLYSLTEVEESTVKLNAQTVENGKATMYAAYIADGVLQPEQVFALEWADKLEGVVVESLGPSAEEMAQELNAQMMAEQQAAGAQGQRGKGMAASPTPVAGVAEKVFSSAGPGGIDVIGAGKG